MKIPPRPRTRAPEDLGFEPRPPVEWFCPGELTATGLRVILSGVFGAYADKRELQAALPAGDPLDYSDRSEVWVDYVSDLGDGFDATMSVASVLAEPKLDPGIPGGRPFPTQRGDLLVMGGDQVYPTATITDYENRLIGPYRAALPYSGEGDGPHLVAIPGNHDWYDGLTSFMRVFCQGNWIGGWQTRQARSYFSVKLPHRWWLWGVDVQFDAYIDRSQLEYFEAAARGMRAGDSVIVCTATPSWVKANKDEPEAFVNLDYLDRKVIRPRGASMRMLVAGDKHHYARYQSTTDDRQLITSGGGGAYLAATHNLPRNLQLPPPRSKDVGKSPPVQYRLADVYPTKKTSRRLSWGVYSLPWRNRTFWALLSGVYLVYGWTILSVQRTEGRGLLGVARTLSYGDILLGLVRSPLAVLMTVVLVAGLSAFTKRHDPLRRFGLGVAHTAGHLALVAATMLAGAAVLASLPGPVLAVALIALVGLVGGLLGCWWVATYLLIADRFGANTNELFSAQRLDGYKNFLRMHVANDGALTLYPIGIRRSCRRWELRPQGAPQDPWFVPAEGSELDPLLIEAPIRLEPLK